MSAAALNPSELLATLSDCGVEFVVIGAMAVGVHAEVRATGDVDLMLPVGDETNARALERALKKLGARRIPLAEGGVERAADDPYPTVMFSTRVGRLDILYRPDGSDSYQAVKRRSVETTIAGRPVAVAGKDDLVRMKLAAGRPDDLRDVASLTAGEHEAPRHVLVRMPLARNVDEEWAAELAGARVSLFDPDSTVSTRHGLLEIEATRSGLSDGQIEQWARALAERLHGAEILAEATARVEIDHA